MERIAMSQEERDKLEWLKRARDKGISQREAASKIGVSDRWVRKLLKRMKKQGDRVEVHGLRGRTSNRKITARVQVRAVGQVAWYRAERRDSAAVDDPSGVVEEPRAQA